MRRPKHWPELPTFCGSALRTSGSRTRISILCRRPTAKVSKYCPDLVVETDLVCRVDFNALFAKVDEPTE
jgi:hypothetical protein